jgi:hypothetical protein
MMHAIRAAGVVSGQVAPTPVPVQWNLGEGIGAVQQVPRGLGHSAKCWAKDTRISAACAEQIGGGPVEDVPTSAGRYSPVYYFAVGLPIRWAPNWYGLVAARMISAALSAAMLAWAFVTLIRWSRYGLMLAALLACASPMLAHLAGSINPNSLEIAAGIAMFSGAIPLLVGRPERSFKPLVWLTGVSAVLLASLRALGPLWLLAGLSALLLPQSRTYLRLLWSHRLVKAWTIAIGGSLAFAVAWTIGMKTGDVPMPSDGGFRYGYAQAILIYFDSWDNYLRGLVGVAGWFDVFMPNPFYWAWICAVASLVILALAVSGWQERWRFFVIFLGGVIAPGVLQVIEVKSTGFISQGRYMMPLLVAVPLLAAFIVERGVLTAKLSHSMTKLFCVLLLPSHLVLLVYAMVRWQRGMKYMHVPSYLNPLAGTWHPQTGSLLPLLIMVVGMAVVGWVFWRAPALAAAVPVPSSLAGEASGKPELAGSLKAAAPAATAEDGLVVELGARREVQNHVASGG